MGRVEGREGRGGGRGRMESREGRERGRGRGELQGKGEKTLVSAEMKLDLSDWVWKATSPYCHQRYFWKCCLLGSKMEWLRR